MTWVMVYMPDATADICEYQDGRWAPPPPRKPNYERWVHGAVFLLRLVI